MAVTPCPECGYDTMDMNVCQKCGAPNPNVGVRIIDDVKPLPEKMRRQRYTRGTRSISVRVPETRMGECIGNHSNVKKTNLHHWKNSYTLDEVRTNPLLALEDTSEVGFSCHRICNALRNLAEFATRHPDRFISLLSAMPVDMRNVLREMI